jgi:hypothetical protein
VNTPVLNALRAELERVRKDKDAVTGLDQHVHLAIVPITLRSQAGDTGSNPVGAANKQTP